MEQFHADERLWWSAEIKPLMKVVELFDWVTAVLPVFRLPWNATVPPEQTTLVR